MGGATGTTFHSTFDYHSILVTIPFLSVKPYPFLYLLGISVHYLSYKIQVWNWHGFLLGVALPPILPSGQTIHFNIRNYYLFPLFLMKPSFYSVMTFRRVTAWYLLVSCWR